MNFVKAIGFRATMSVSARAAASSECASSWASEALLPGVLVAIAREDRRLPPRVGRIDAAAIAGGRWQVDVTLINSSLAALVQHGAVFAGQRQQRVRLTDGDFERLRVVRSAEDAAELIAAAAPPKKASPPLRVGAFCILLNRNLQRMETADCPAIIVARVESPSAAQNPHLLRMRWFRETAVGSQRFERTSTLFSIPAQQCTLWIRSMVPDVLGERVGAFWTCDAEQRAGLEAKARLSAASRDLPPPTQCTCATTKLEGGYYSARMIEQTSETDAARSRRFNPTSLEGADSLCVYCKHVRDSEGPAIQARLDAVVAARAELALLRKRWTEVTTTTTVELCALKQRLVALGCGGP